MSKVVVGAPAASAVPKRPSTAGKSPTTNPAAAKAAVEVVAGFCKYPSNAGNNAGNHAGGYESGHNVEYNNA